MSIPTFVAEVSEYIETITKHKDYSTDPWYLFWKQWLDEDLLVVDILHMLVVTIEHPLRQPKTTRNVVNHMFNQLPILDRYVHIPRWTKDDEPLYHMNKPIINDHMPKVQSKPILAITAEDNAPTTVLTNNLFEILVHDDDTVSLSVLGQQMEDLLATDMDVVTDDDANRELLDTDITMVKDEDD